MTASSLQLSLACAGVGAIVYSQRFCEEAVRAAYPVLTAQSFELTPRKKTRPSGFTG